ncbi:hypothetical protein [Vibrio cholerae]|uniref:hypothetical protein n=1 Tax=Vibrio cholerae TaxID=666 RepID=UPI002DAF8C4C|nr:hypothetical protein [Vibrio cholerae]MEB5518206.1 hypothetical protein [Vibrio cholerae]
MEIIITTSNVIGAILGAGFGALVTVMLPIKRNNKQFAFMLYEKFISPDFHLVRAEVWEIQLNWRNGDRTCVDFFIKGRSHLQEFNNVAKNGLSGPQNLSLLLNFFASINEYYESGLINKKLAIKLFKPNYSWFRQFFIELKEEYCTFNSERETSLPLWVESIEKLDKLFGYKK